MKRMIVFSILFSLVLVISSAGDAAAEDARAFIIIVNESQTVTSLSRTEVSKLFLKKIKQWDETGDAVFPVDLTSHSLLRKKFSTAIHDRKIASIQAYWQKQIFSGRGVPPEEKRSDKEVLRYVSEHSGAIGYISAKTAIEGEGVNIIELVD